MYSFPAVKGCPLKVPFVHRLHFVIQIALFFKMAWGSRLSLSAAGREEKRLLPIQRSGTTFFLRLEMNPLHCTSPISSLPFQKPYIYIYIYSTKGNWCELVLYFLLINDDKKFFWKGKKTCSRTALAFFLPLCLHCLFSLRHWSSL